MELENMLLNEKVSLKDILDSKGPEALEIYLSENPMSQNDLDEALKWICHGGNVGGVQIMLQHGANPNYEDTLGGTVLHFAMRGKHDNVVLILLPHIQEAGLLEPKTAFAILHWACEIDSVQLLRYMVEEVELSVESTEINGRAAIHTACLFGGQNVVEYLVSERLCDVNMPDRTGWTPLHYACSSSSNVNSSKTLISYLIASQANSMLKTPEGKTALHIAFENGREIVLVKSVKTEHLICMMCTVDDIVPGRESQGSTHLHTECTQPPVSPLSRSSSTEERTSMILRAWRKILMNDDVDMLLLLRDSEIWQSGSCNRTFDKSQGFDQQNLLDLFNDCYENGIGVYTYVESTFGYDIRRGELKTISMKLSGLASFDPLLRDGEELIPSPHQSIAVLALLCGRLGVAEMLLRMRQFDIIPAALFMSLIARRLAEVRIFSEQVKNTLIAFSRTSESIAVDSLSHIFLRDNSHGKHVCFENLDIPLPPYGNISLIDLADKAGCTNFLSLQCCQVVLDKRWNGKLSELPAVWRWIFKLCPPLFLIYIRMNIKEKKEEPETLAKRKQSTDMSAHAANYNIQHDLKKLRLNNSLLQQVCFIRHVYNTPSAKYFVHSLLHLLFLALFSYVVLYDFYFNPTISEILCVSFVVGYAVEEIRQFTLYAGRQACVRYISEVWNWIDISAIIITLTGFLVRCARIGYVPATPIAENMESHEAVLYWSRVMLITGLLLFYLRILYLLSISAILGPKLRMIGNMLLNDMFPLLLIFAIFVVAFGVSFQGLLYPNGYPIASVRNSAGDTVGNLFRRAFYGMFGTDYPLEELDCSSGEGCPNKTGKKIVMYVYQVVYILIVNVMLVNLLIALFSNTIAQIDQRSMDHWLAERYNLVEEYNNKSVLPSPLNLLCVLVEIIILIVRFCRKTNVDRYTPTPHDDENENVSTGLILRYLVIQTFALRSHRYHLGGTALSNLVVTGASKRDNMLRKLERKMQKQSEEISEIARFIKEQFDGESDVIGPLKDFQRKSVASTTTQMPKQTIKSKRMSSFMRRLDEETISQV